MDKHEFKNMANNPNFIAGIYNYCDRWCERCAYTSRCFLFATEKQQFPDDESRDITNQKFWKEIENLFRLTFSLLEDTAEELGLDLDKIGTETFEQNEMEKGNRAENHPAVQRAHTYLMAVSNWFEESKSDFEEKENELLKIASLEVAEKDIAETAAGIRDFVEIIRWYQHQLYVKIIRALRGKDDSLIVEDPIQTDYNGSAKVALIGIDRSIAAWGGLLKEFPRKEDDILPLLVMLEQIRNQLKKEFPKAMQFARPGFDG